MVTYIPVFTLRLSAGRSIGHAALQSIWQKAARSRDVSVARAPLAGQGAPSWVYTLSGTRSIEDLANVEVRLRELLHQSVHNTQVTLTALA